MKKLNLKGLNRMARAVQAGEEFLPGCSGKRAYDTGAEATEMVSIRNAAGAKKLSTYQCRHCRKWHITSHAKRNKTGGR